MSAAATTSTCAIDAGSSPSILIETREGFEQMLDQLLAQGGDRRWVCGLPASRQLDSLKTS